MTTRSLPPLRTDVLVIGSGISGLYASWLLSKNGANVVLCGSGTPSSEMSTGCLNFPSFSRTDIEEGEDQDRLAQRCHRDTVEICGRSDYSLEGRADQTVRLMDRTGLLHNTNLAPHFSFRRTEELEGKRLEVIELEGIADLDASVFSKVRSARSGRPVPARVFGPGSPLHELRANGASVDLDAAVTVIKASAADVVVIPPLFGLRDHDRTMGQMEIRSGRMLVEPVTPLSLPGMRLMDAFRAQVRGTSTTILDGHRLVHWRADGSSLTSVTLRTGLREREVQASKYLFCGGSLIGGGLVLEGRKVVDPLHLLDIAQAQGTEDPLQRAMMAGCRTDGEMHGYHDGRRLENVWISGAALPGNALPLSSGMGGAMMASAQVGGWIMEAGH